MLKERTLPGLHASLTRELDSLPREAPILDLGCGTGAWLARLAESGFTDLTGMDADLQREGTIVADLDKPISLPRRFAFISAIEIIEHLNNPGRIFEIAASSLVPGGKLLVTSPNIHALRARIKYLLRGELPHFDRYGDPTHVAPLYLPGIRRVAERNGLAFSKAWTYTPDKPTFRPAVRFMAALARPVLSDPLPGDILCAVFTAP